MALDVGQVIDGKYRIVRVIGEGGMGEVYEGENVRIRRRVAIKVLHPGLTSNADLTQRFEREAQAAGCIGNDHILEVLDLGVLADSSFYMVMELLDGEPLSKRIETSGRLSPQQIAPLATQLLDGLAAAHNAGIIHRDLKPDNIFILKKKAGHTDFVKIIDFGISKFQPLSGDGMKMTRTGAVMGTPYYMSPEQANGNSEADARTDLYAVGVILYEAVTGRVPFDAPTFNQLLFQIVLTEPPPPSALAPGLDAAFETIILKAMARDMSSRFQSAAEFIAALRAWERTGAGVPVPPPAQMGHLAAAARAALPSHPGMTPAHGSAAARTSGSGSDWSASQSAAHGISSPALNPGTAQIAVTPGSYPGATTPIGGAATPNIAPRATGGSWATSQPGVTPTGGVRGITPKSPLLLIAAAIAGVAILGGLVGLVLLLRPDASAAPASASSSPESVSASPVPLEAVPIEKPVERGVTPTVTPADTVAEAPTASSSTAKPPEAPRSNKSSPALSKPAAKADPVVRQPRETSKPSKPKQTSGQDGEGDFGY